MNKGEIVIKSPEEIEVMREGGKKLAKIKNALKKAVKIGANAAEIEELAVSLIEKEGAKPSFAMVPGYSWATCINVNDGLVHGIPKKEAVFRKGDLVSVDVGIYYKGFHTDTSFSLGLDADGETSRFLNIGEEALDNAIKAAVPGNYIFDISKAMEETLAKAGYSPIRALVGHGVGRELHEEPQIPCFVPGKVEDSPEIREGMVFAIEAMFALGAPDVYQDNDGWTIRTRDGKISALFEDTVAVGKDKAEVLTR